MTIEITNLFLNEVRKNIENDNLMSLFKTYLEKVETSNNIFEHILLSCVSNEKDTENSKSMNKQNLKNENQILFSSKSFNVINACHKLYTSSQRMLNDLSIKDITPYKDRDIDIIMCFTFYSSIYVILESNLDESEFDRIVEIYEDANLRMNVPRNDEEENGEFFEILRIYYCNLVIPFKLINMEFPLNEYEFASLVLKEKIPKFVKDKIENINVFSKVENKLVKEALNMCLKEFK